MVYIPNPTDATQPTGNVDASTADDEFRALKAYVLGLALTAGMFAPVRQCANDGMTDASGDPALFTAAAAGGLAIDFKATGRPLVANFAGGSTGTGVNDRNSSLTADAANVVTALPALNTSYIYADYVNAAAMTWGQTLIPPQYGKAFDRTRQELLRFAGADASVSMISDYGNTWTPAGNAQIDTAVQIDGLNTLLCDGAGDWIESTNFTSLGIGSWTLETKVRWNTVPSVGTNQAIFSAVNAVPVGLVLFLSNTAGVTKLAIALSSNGTTSDIAASTLGTKTVWANATTYHIAVTFDALAGKYFIYVDGVLDQTVVSALKVCALTRIRVCDSAGVNNLNGAVAGVRLSPFCRYPNGVAFAAPNISTFAVEGDTFDIQGMKMYTVTAASVVAGVNPTFTQKYRVYFGEVDTSALIPTALRSYAFNGKVVTALQNAAAGAAAFAFPHNLGMFAFLPTLFLQNINTEQGYSPGNQVLIGGGTDSSTQCWDVVNVSRNNITFIQSAMPVVANLVTGTRTAITAANWKIGVIASRGWGGA